MTKNPADIECFIVNSKKYINIGINKAPPPNPPDYAKPASVNKIRLPNNFLEFNGNNSS